MIQTRNLSFFYNKQKGIRQLDLHVPKGSCYGLLGQNGAGKTTTMKVLLGLLKADEGEVYVDGKLMQPQQLDIFHRLGALIEDPPLYPYLTAYENLEVTCTYRAITTQRIGEVLEMVGLSEVEQQRIGTFSTGMKQRLGMALALLPDPELLILDEPVNGLDPEGIVAIRRLIQELHKKGKTILLSSHLLHEVEQNCDHVGILQDGQLLFSGSMESLKNRQALPTGVWITSPQSVQAQQILDRSHFQTKLDTDRVFVHLQDEKKSNQVIDLLRAEDIDIREVTRPRTRLEDLYLYFTKKGTSPL